MFHLPVIAQAGVTFRSARARKKRPSAGFSRRLGIEMLERRELLAVVNWTGGGGNLNWGNPANWDAGGSLPGPADDVVIDAPGDVAILHSGFTTAIQSLTLRDSLSVSLGSLTVSDSLNASGGTTIQATTTTGSIVVNGNSAIAGTRLHAVNGGRISLPGLTAYDGQNTAPFRGWRAEGDGSVLDLSNLTLLTRAGFGTGDYRHEIAAIGGGAVDLRGVTTITDGGFIVLADGADSRIDLSGLTRMAPAIGSEMEARNEGWIAAGSLTTLERTVLTLGATGGMPTAQIQSVTAGGGIITSQTADFSGLTNATASDLVAKGGATLFLPELRQYDGQNSTSFRGWRAEGEGSVLDLSNLTLLTRAGIGNGDGRHDIVASSGGVVDLRGITDISDGGFVVLADGADSLIDLSGLTRMSPTQWYSEIEARNGGWIAAGKLTALERTVLTLGATGGMPTAQLRSVTGGGGIITSQTADFSGLTNVTNSDLVAKGGATLYLPELRQYDGQNAASPWGWRAEGEGSVLDLSNLTLVTRAGLGTGDGRHEIAAVNGGLIDLHEVTAILDSAVAILADVTDPEVVSKSEIDLSGMTLLTPTFDSSIEARNHGRIRFSGVIADSTAEGVLLGEGGRLTIGNGVAINGAPFVNRGTLDVAIDSIVDMNTSLELLGSSSLAELPSGILRISSDILGDTDNAGGFSPMGRVTFDGAGTAASPQRLEAMSQNLWRQAAGFHANFAYGKLVLAPGTYVKLVDVSDNAPGTAPEAVYTDTLLVAPGSTLDLNGLKLYARAVQIDGTVVGGAVLLVADGGALDLGVPATGSISSAGEIDEWTFSGEQGMVVSVLVNPGDSRSPAPISPTLDYARVELLDSQNNILGTAASAYRTTVLIPNIALAADGAYTVRVSAPDDHGSNTGNYTVLVDTVNPKVTVDSLVTNDNTPTLSGTVRGGLPDTGIAEATVVVAGLTIPATVRGGVWIATVPTDQAPNGLPDGAYDVQVTAIDNAGYGGHDTTLNELFVDTVAPTATADRLITNKKWPKLTGTVSDATPSSGVAEVLVGVNGLTIRATVAGGKWSATVTTDHLATGLPDGTYEVVVTVTDNARNEGAYVLPGALTVETTAPTATVDKTKTMDKLVTNSKWPMLTGTATPAVPDGGIAQVLVTIGGKTIVADINRNTWGAQVAKQDFPAGLADGPHDVLVTPTDGAGNSKTYDFPGALFVDTVAPTAAVDTGITNQRWPILTGTVSDAEPSSGIADAVTVIVAGLTLEGKVNSGTWTAAVTRTQAPNGLADGTYGVQVISADKAENTYHKSVFGALVVDTSVPQVTTSPGSVPYTHPDVAVTIDDGLTVTDGVPVRPLTGAWISIDPNTYLRDWDRLGFVDQNGITGTWHGESALLTLSGAASVGDYQAALRSVTYTNTFAQPFRDLRTVHFWVSDGANWSAWGTRDITLDYSPILTEYNNTPIIYKPNADKKRVNVFPSINVRDVDDDHLIGATIQIVGSPTKHDKLVFKETPTIKKRWDAATHTLTLVGNDTTENYQEALRNVMFFNDKSNARPHMMTVTVTANDGFSDSYAESRVVVVDNLPVLKVNEQDPLSYWAGKKATVVARKITVSDADETSMARATIQITGNYARGEDELKFTDTARIKGEWNEATGTLTLTTQEEKNAGVAAYQAALQAVKYHNSSRNPSTATRTVTFTINDGLLDSAPVARKIKVTKPSSTLVAADYALGAVGAFNSLPAITTISPRSSKAAVSDRATFDAAVFNSLSPEMNTDYVPGRGTAGDRAGAESPTLEKTVATVAARLTPSRARNASPARRPAASVSRENDAAILALFTDSPLWRPAATRGSS